MIFANAESEDFKGLIEDYEDNFKHKGQIRHFFSEEYTKNLLNIFKEVYVETVEEEQIK